MHHRKPQRGIPSFLVPLILGMLALAPGQADARLICRTRSRPSSGGSAQSQLNSPQLQKLTDAQGENVKKLKEQADSKEKDGASDAKEAKQKADDAQGNKNKTDAALASAGKALDPNGPSGQGGGSEQDCTEEPDPQTPKADDKQADAAKPEEKPASDQIADTKAPVEPAKPETDEQKLSAAKKAVPQDQIDEKVSDLQKQDIEGLKTWAKEGKGQKYNYSSYADEKDPSGKENWAKQFSDTRSQFKAGTDANSALQDTFRDKLGTQSFNDEKAATITDPVEKMMNGKIAEKTGDDFLFSETKDEARKAINGDASYDLARPNDPKAEASSVFDGADESSPDFQKALPQKLTEHNLQQLKESDAYTQAYNELGKGASYKDIDARAAEIAAQPATPRQEAYVANQTAAQMKEYQSPTEWSSDPQTLNSQLNQGFVNAFTEVATGQNPAFTSLGDKINSLLRR